MCSVLNKKELPLKYTINNSKEITGKLKNINTQGIISFLLCGEHVHQHPNTLLTGDGDT